VGDSTSEPEPRLADGSRPMTPTGLLVYLEKMGIDAVTHEHAPVFTVDEAKDVRGHLPGCHTKNLFVRNKKERMFLVVCEQDRRVDLKELGELLGAGRLSFGSPRRLMRRLGVTPGSVNPFAVLNDVEGAVEVVLDRAILKDEPLNFHPLDNAMTTAISTDALLRFLHTVDHPPRVMDFPAPTP